MMLDFIWKIWPKFYMTWGDKSETNSSSETKNDWRMAPEYAESEGARKNWWDTLQKWQTEPGYGAIQPDWNSIWENARGKVSRYFGGGPEGPGLDSKVKAGLARRGMAENPASDALLQRSGFQQGNMLQDIAIDQATKEAALGEQGRQTWLSSMMQLAGLKPQMLNYGSSTTGSSTTTQTPGAASMIMAGLGAASSYGGGMGGMGGMSDLDSISQLYGSGGVDTGIGDLSSMGDDELTQLFGGGNLFG